MADLKNFKGFTLPSNITNEVKKIHGPVGVIIREIINSMARNDKELKHQFSFVDSSNITEVDTSITDITSGDTQLVIEGSLISLRDDSLVLRFKAGFDGSDFVFSLYDDEGNVVLYLDADGNPIFNDLEVDGDIVVSGTVDGIDIATDVAANTLKVTESTTVTDTDTIDMTLDTYDIKADVKTDSINDTHIDWGVGANQVYLKDLINYADSPMIVTGGEISQGTNVGTFKVGALTALLRSSNSLTGELTYVTLAEQDNQAITDPSTTYIVALNYNGGSPTISISETNPYTADKRNIPIGKVNKQAGGDIHYISGGFNLQDGVRKLHERARTLRTLELASGSTISYAGTDNFEMTAAIVYGGINKFTPILYKSADTQFTAVYSDGDSGWTTALRNTIDFEHYDDGSGTLHDIGNNKYGCHWVYRHVDDGHVFVRYGVDSYSLAEAETAPEPTKSDMLTDFGALIGCIIAPQAGGSFASIQMVTDTTFTGISVANHNQLGELQGGTAGEYYHLTAAEHAIKIDYNLDGGRSDTTYGGTTAIDGGDANDF